MMTRVLLVACLAALGQAALSSAQTVVQATAQQVESTPEPSAPQAPPASNTDRRECDGCPPRSVGKALLQTTLINVFYELVNLAAGQVTAKLTPKTWWANMQNGWVWDLDEFAVNQIGHPYQGNNYFNAARANGLGFYESAAVTAFGSATWEYFGETNKPSLNDLINTTLGGAALGEMFHRAGWLVRNPQATGRGRLWGEIGAMVLDPVTGANRFITGDASRVTERPPDLVPSSLGGLASAGVLWRGNESSAFDAPPDPFLEVDLLYGDVDSGRSRTPYDAFALRMRLGGGAAVSEAKVRGRLAGQPLRHGTLHFSVVQDYDYEANDVYRTGGQSFDAALGFTKQLTPRTSMWLLGWGGLTVLGAVDSLPLGVTEPPPEDSNESAGEGVSVGPRYYDYGPGSLFGVTARFARNERPFATISYEGRHLYSLDGVRANHFLQRGRLDLLAPLRGRLGIGASAEYFDRHTFYQDANRTRVSHHYPQLRAYLTWRLQ